MVAGESNHAVGWRKSIHRAERGKVRPAYIAGDIPQIGLDGKISFEQYRKTGRYAEDQDESRRRVSEIKADIARLPQSEILEIIIFSASALREKT